jgi:hypothetical protein
MSDCRNNGSASVLEELDWGSRRYSRISSDNGRSADRIFVQRIGKVLGRLLLLITGIIRDINLRRLDANSRFSACPGRGSCVFLPHCVPLESFRHVFVPLCHCLIWFLREGLLWKNFWKRTSGLWINDLKLPDRLLYERYMLVWAQQ